MALRSEQSNDPLKSDELADLISDYGYDVPDLADVGQYLLEHLEVVPILREATPELARYFPKEAHRILRVFRDQEFGDVGPLFVVIEWPRHSSSDATNRLDRFETEWWIPKAIESNTGSRLVFDVV